MKRRAVHKLVQKQQMHQQKCNYNRATTGKSAASSGRQPSVTELFRQVKQHQSTSSVSTTSMFHFDARQLRSLNKQSSSNASAKNTAASALIAIPGQAEGKTSQLRSYNRTSRLLKGSPYMLNSEHKPIPVVPTFNDHVAKGGRQRRGSIASNATTVCTAAALQQSEEKREVVADQ